MATLKDIAILFLLILGVLGFLFSFGEDIDLKAGTNILLTPNPILRAGVIALQEDIIVNDLTATGNITSNQIYGQMWNRSAATNPYVFTIDSVGVYYNLTGLTSNSGTNGLNGFNFTDETQLNGGSFLTAQVSGRYSATASICSIVGVATGNIYGYAISQNFSRENHNNCYARRTAVNQVGCIPITCFIDVPEDTTVNLQVEQETGGVARDITFHTVNINLVRIGDIK